MGHLWGTESVTFVNFPNLPICFRLGAWQKSLSGHELHRIAASAARRAPGRPATSPPKRHLARRGALSQPVGRWGQIRQGSEAAQTQPDGYVSCGVRSRAGSYAAQRQR